ncbi:MAG: GIY-YIG nuclease family protein [Acidobacteriota bacterium]|nr:GIY-YIG nuclease family protein [Acidobacteriota bacterium]
MKQKRRSKAGLVIEHLEGIARSAIRRYPDIITEFAKGRSGVYALYKGKDLYYVGLAKNLRSRLRGHLRDRHAEAWDRFNIYLTQGDEHLKELESLVLRIASPKGNRVAGKFAESSDLFGIFRQRIIDSQKRELVDITLPDAPRVSKDTSLRRKRGEYDTIVCPAHREGFEKVFLGKNCWYAIRISKNVIPRLRYIAVYVTSPINQISHYGRIKAIKPWRNSGKYIVWLREKARRIGPIEFSPKVHIQAPRFALMARLQRARTLADAL